MTTTTKMINLCSIKCDTSLESQDQGDLESDDDDNIDDDNDNVDDIINNNSNKNHKSL